MRDLLITCGASSREILTRLYLREQTVDQVSAAMNVPADHVREVRARMRTRFRTCKNGLAAEGSTTEALPANRMREAESTLAAELRAAQLAFPEAVFNLSRVASEFASKTPGVDFQRRVADAESVQTLAYNGLIRALLRWENFAARGEIPADLAKKNPLL